MHTIVVHSLSFGWLNDTKMSMFEWGWSASQMDNQNPGGIQGPRFRWTKYICIYIYMYYDKIYIYMYYDKIYIYIYVVIIDICLVYGLHLPLQGNATTSCLDDNKLPSTLLHLLSPHLFAAWLALRIWGDLMSSIVSHSEVNMRTDLDSFLTGKGGHGSDYAALPIDFEV